VQVIQDLNPELRRWTTPLRSTDYSLRVPEGSADVVRTRLAETHPDELAPLNRHTVRRSETLASIAKKLGVNRVDLAEANYLSAKARLNAGQQLIIPRPPALLVAARADDPVTSGEVDHPVAVIPRPAVPVESVPAERTKLTHRVKRGDTLFSIARLYRTTVESVKQWNGIRGNAIQVGQRLTIFRTIVTS
jgi:membrane-bound lytic murein transglycosylase D